MDDGAAPGHEADGRPHRAVLSCQLKNFLRPCLLLLLDERPAYGYEMRDRLRPFNTGAWDHGTVYRALNTMEDEGLVLSTWERSASGPRRRRYALTGSGRATLEQWAHEVEIISGQTTGFLDRYRTQPGALLGASHNGAAANGGASPDHPREDSMLAIRGH